MTQTLLRRITFTLLALILLAPFVVIAGVSVNARKALTFPPEGFNPGWYADLFRESDWFAALTNSVGIAVMAATLSVLIALPLAWFNWRWRLPLGRVVMALGYMPFLLPPVISAMGYLSFWVMAGTYGDGWTIVVAHAVFLVTLPLVSLTLGFNSIDPALVEAARSMGADDRTVLRTVVLPMVRPYLISGFAFVFVSSLHEYIVAAMTMGAVMETLPMKIFNALRYGYTPVMAAASVLFVAVTVLILSLVAWFGDLPRLLGAVRK
jgi:putative spermidine/putrescine transport system permease protein